MNDAVRRLVIAHAAVTASRQPSALHQPDVFARTMFATDEIHEALQRTEQHVAALKIARGTRNLGAMRAANETIAKLAKQIDQLAGVIARQIELTGHGEAS